MRVIRLLFLLLFLVLVGPMVVQAGEPVGGEGEVDMLAMYRPYAGKWESVTKGKATDVIEEPYETKGPWVQRDILDGRVIEMRGSVEGIEQPYSYMWLYTYDQREESYVGWFHDSRGVNSKMFGSWSEEDKKMTWTIDDPGEWGIMVTVVDDLSDPDKIGFTFKMESDDGTLIMDEAGYAVRAKEE